MELEVIEYIKKNGQDHLTKNVGLKASRHQTYLNLVQFSYSQTGSPMEFPIVRECRGIILDSKNGWQVVAFPYKKFFNHGEPFASEIDWTTAKIFEKIDGSLASVYWYDQKWHVASSSVPDGSGIIFEKMSFSELFWEIWNNCGYELPSDKECTYMFEMITPRNPIIVKPTREAIILHGIRDNKTYEEIDPCMVAGAHGWEVVPVYPFGSIEEVLEAAIELNPLKNEGYVVCDGKWNRVKVKSPQYVALTYLHSNTKDNVNMRHMLEIVRLNEGDEFLVHFPEFTELYYSVKMMYDLLVENVESCLGKEKEPTKDEQRLLDEMEDKMISGSFGIRQFLKTYEIDQLCRILNIKTSGKKSQLKNTTDKNKKNRPSKRSLNKEPNKT